MFVVYIDNLRTQVLDRLTLQVRVNVPIEGAGVPTAGRCCTIADPEPATRRAIRRLLRPQNLKWSEVSSKPQLLVEARHARDGLIILAAQLSDCSASEALAQLRREGCESWVIVLTHWEHLAVHPQEKVRLLDRLQIGANLPELVGQLLLETEQESWVGH